MALAQKILSLFIPSLKYASLNFSQEGEELILRRYFEHKKDGFFIDIGAHHPFRFSNTYSFYRRGWNGINIDPLPGVMDLFKKHRNRDINLEIGISREEKPLTYFRFNEPAINTFSENEYNKIIAKKTYQFINKTTIQTFPLASILNQHLPKGREIDFMTIDVEGLDIEVLMSNNWNEYRPEIVLIESHNMAIQDPSGHPVHQFMCSQQYELWAKTYYTVFYKRK